MTTSGACMAGACSACRCTSTTCECPHHLDGAARTAPRPEACPHCGATAAVPLSKGLYCTNPWHDGAARTTEPVDLPDRCSQCGQAKPDRVGLTLLETDEVEADDFGFCSIACMVAFVRSRWIEAA